MLQACPGTAAYRNASNVICERVCVDIPSLEAPFLRNVGALCAQ
jgi:hypothetical protein